MNSEQTTLLDVEGMTCGSCVRHINQALGSLEGVREVQVKMREGQALVLHDFAKISIDGLIEALSEAGYSGKAAS